MSIFGPEQREQLKIAGRVGAVGIEMAVATLLGYWGGGWLDGKLETAPTLTLVGVVLGILAGFKGLIDLARKTKLDDL
jgi:ATP synthase protein I